MCCYKKIILGLLLTIGWWIGCLVGATTVGIHGVQGIGTQQILEREKENNATLPIIGIIFDAYSSDEQKKLSDIVRALGTGRIYHISISPFGYTAEEVAGGYFDTTYRRFFTDIKQLGIKVVFRTMHEMNGGRYSRASHPDDFKRAWKKVRTMARNKYHLQSDQLLFSLSFNSQDLPTKDTRPTQNSEIQFCSERRVVNRERCPRKADYYPGDKYVDLVGVTLYNRGRSRPDTRAKWKSPTNLFNEDSLWAQLTQRGKPIIIDELGSTAVNFSGEWSHLSAKEVFDHSTVWKNNRLKQRQIFIRKNPIIKAIVYFNLDPTAGASKQIHGQADRSIILSDHHDDYKEATKRLTTNNSTGSLAKMFKKKK